MRAAEIWLSAAHMAQTASDIEIIEGRKRRPGPDRDKHQYAGEQLRSLAQWFFRRSLGPAQEIDGVIEFDDDEITPTLPIPILEDP